YSYIRSLLLLVRPFFFPPPASTELYTLSLHDALPIWFRSSLWATLLFTVMVVPVTMAIALALAILANEKIRGIGFFRTVNNKVRSEEHTSELQSRFDLVCRLLLEKKKRKKFTQESTS